MDTNIILPEEFYISYFYTGSSVICDPPILDTDMDIMFLTDNKIDFEQELREDQWVTCSQEEYEEFETSCWKAYRKGKLNYLFTDNKEYYDQFLAATLEAKEKNLLKKEDRIALFDTYLNKFKKDLTPEQKQSIIKAKKINTLSRNSQVNGISYSRLHSTNYMNSNSRITYSISYDDYRVFTDNN